jgi:acyl-CoA reductase-like NAD-dependent aldehyde dehydrogenase
VADEIARFNGKTQTEALMSEVYPTLATFRFFATKGRKALSPRHIGLNALPGAYSRLEFEPLGVVGVISPWNFPFKLMLQDVPAALMAGNSVLIKVSEHAAAIGPIIEELLAASDIPSGLVTLLQGEGDVGQALIQSGIDKVVFTGSTRTGKSIYQAAAEAMIPATLEMGGKDAAILLPDAPIDETARGVLWAAMTNSGQVCASIERIYVPESIKSAFVQRLGQLLESLPTSSLGTMNTHFQREKVAAQVAEAQEAGARVAAVRRAGDDEGVLAMDRLVLCDVDSGVALHREETFGPAVAVVGYEDLEGVLSEINTGEFGLTTSIWTNDRPRARRLASRIQTGAVTINEHLITPGFPEAPWTGHRGSGMGFSMSLMSLVGFSRLRYVFDDRGLIRFRFWRYPYDAAKRAWFEEFIDAKYATGPRRLFAMARALPAIFLRRNRDWER